MRIVRRLLWPAVAAAGVGAEAASFGLDDPGRWIPDLATGWALAACGLIAWERRARSATGPLLVASGVLWFVGNLSAALVFAYRGPLLHATLTYPGGRPRGRVQTLAVAAAYLTAAIAPVWRSQAATIALSGAFVAAALWHRRSAVGRERRERSYALRATLAVAGLLAGAAAFRVADPSPGASDASLLIFEALLVTLTIALVHGLLVEPWAHATSPDLVVELGESHSGALRDQLARALGDPTLQVAFPVGDRYVDGVGRPVLLPERGSPRRTTAIERGGRAVAVLVHDAALVEDPALTTALSQAAELAAANARLHAEVRSQITELEASRRRLLATADDERRRLEQRLRQTALRRLAQLLPELEQACGEAAGDDDRAVRLHRAADQLEQSLADLRRLAAGLHPRELAGGGLTDALHALAARSPVPVEVAVAMPDGVPAEAEHAAYFVCSEGLANVAKYAAATTVRVSVGILHGRLRVEVADDGRGGADPDAGTGLRGLTDRVESLGGALVVDSEPAAGTRLVAEIPLTGS
jgi:signal transduction histidine kinase